jgi:hypothetical protein
MKEVEMDESERLRRQELIRELRSREKREPRFDIEQLRLREKGMRERDDRQRERAEQREAERVFDWVQQKQFEDEAQHGEPVRAAAGETPLTEDFNWQWVDRRIAARLREERAYFEQRMEEMNSALVDNARAVGDALDAVDAALTKAANKGNKELAGALQKITDTMAANQHAIMRVLNNRIDDKPADEPQGQRRGVH